MYVRLDKNKWSFGSIGVFPPTEPMHLISTLSSWAEHTSSKCGGVHPPSSTSESSKPAIMMHTRCRQFLLLMFDFKTQNKEEEQVKKDEPVKPKSKLKTKMGLVEKGDITIRGVITRILIFRANRGTWSMNFIRRSLVQRTYNTEPSPKELAWGRCISNYPAKYIFTSFYFK